MQELLNHQASLSPEEVADDMTDARVQAEMDAELDRQASGEDDAMATVLAGRGSEQGYYDVEDLREMIRNHKGNDDDLKMMQVALVAWEKDLVALDESWNQCFPDKAVPVYSPLPIKA